MPHTTVAAGLYLGVLLLAAVGALGRLQGGVATWALAWWQRRRGEEPLTVEGEALLILLGFTLVWIVSLALLLVVARAFPG